MNIGRREFNQTLLGAMGVFSVGLFQSQSQLRVNGPRIIDHINALAEFGKNPLGGVTRVAYSDADRQGREYVLALMRAAKLDPVVALRAE